LFDVAIQTGTETVPELAAETAALRTESLFVVSILLLGIEEDAVVDDDDKVVFAVVREVGDERFARFGKFVAAAAEGAFLEDLPAIRGDEVVRFFEGDEVEIAFAGFEEDEVFAFVTVEIAGNDVVEITILDRSFVAVQFSEFPDVAIELEPGDGVKAEEGDCGRFFVACDRLERLKIGEGKGDVFCDFPHAAVVAFGKREEFALSVEKKESRNFAALLF